MKKDKPGDFYEDSMLASIKGRWHMSEGWLDKKRWKAVEHIYRKVDHEILNSLPPIIIYAPYLHIFAHGRRSDGGSERQKNDSSQRRT
jgi:hypothetical protein